MSRDWSPIESVDPVELAKGLLEAVTAVDPTLRGPRYIELDSEMRGNVTLPVGGLPLRLKSGRFPKIVAEQRRMEVEMAETGHHERGTGATYQVALIVEKQHHHVFGLVRALVNHGTDEAFTIELSIPEVDNLVFADVECTIADRIRVATYLVRLGCDFVGRVGASHGFLRHAVAVLGDLVRMARDQQSKDTTQSAHATPAADEQPRVPQQGKQFTHTPDSNRSKEQP